LIHLDAARSTRQIISGNHGSAVSSERFQIGLRDSQSTDRARSSALESQVPLIRSEVVLLRFTRYIVAPPQLLLEIDTRDSRVKAIIRIGLLMVVFLLFSHLNPWPLFLLSHLPPDPPNDARYIAMVVLYRLWDLLLPNKVAAKEDERIPRTRDVPSWLLACVGLLRGVWGGVSRFGEYNL
jgi:hypothetical protein